MSGEETDRLAAGLKALAADMRGVEAPERVERRLVEAFRTRQVRGRRPARRVGRGWWFPLAAWATAAAAATALAVFLVRDHQPQPVRQPARNAVQLAGLDSDTETIADEDGGFILLPNAERISPNEEVDVVRVEVPRSAFAALGLLVSDEESAETVQADVALGADGLARAVRILDE